MEDIFNDTTLAELGVRIIEILENVNFIRKELIKYAYNHKAYVLKVKHDFLHPKESRDLFTLPSKLPMIVKPKPYSKETFGGYILNNVNFCDDLFIKRHAYGYSSQLSDNSKIYDMINNMSSIPFKINTELLEYVLDKGHQLGLIINPADKHKFADIGKRTKYQEGEFISHNSKIMVE